MSMFSTIGSIIGSALLMLASLFGAQQPMQVGAVNSGATPLFDTVLTQQLGTSDTTMYLKSMTDSQGNVLTGYQCMTVDVNSPSVEYVCGTVSGLTLTNLTRNLSYQTGTSTYATPSYIHRVGADVRITDFPGLTVLTNQALGKETYSAPLLYASHPCSVSSASTTICDKNYIDSSVVSGASPFSDTVAGIGLLATAAQAASSTGTGVYNGNTYNRALWASYATDTPTQSTASASKVVMSDLTGYIKQGWLNLTQAFTWTGLQTFNAGFIDNASSTQTGSTTFIGNTTFLGPLAGAAKNASSTTYLSSGTYSVSTNAKVVEVELWGGGGGGAGGNTSSYGGGGGGGGSYTREFLPVSTISSPVTITIGSGGSHGNSGSPGTAGSAGGSTTFGSYLTAYGGGGGGNGNGATGYGGGGGGLASAGSTGGGSAVSGGGYGGTTSAPGNAYAGGGSSNASYYGGGGGGSGTNSTAGAGGASVFGGAGGSGGGSSATTTRAVSTFGGSGGQAPGGGGDGGIVAGNGQTGASGEARITEFF